MHKERMIETIALLRSIADKPFSYEKWGHEASPYARDRHTCHTIACAAGYMTLHKPFQAAGLRMRSKAELQPHYKGVKGYEAIADFLDISRYKAGCIFVDLHFRTDRQVNEITAADVANALQELLDDAE